MKKSMSKSISRVLFIYPTIHPSTHPDAHEAIPQYDPGQEKDEGFVTAEEGWYIGAVELSQSLKVKVVCHNPQKAEGATLVKNTFAVSPSSPKNRQPLSEIPRRQKINSLSSAHNAHSICLMSI